MNTQNIRAGDTVRHVPSGETWLVAAVCAPFVYCAGWPLSIAALHEVEVVARCDDAAHEQMLWDCAAIDGGDPRRSAAWREIEARLATDRFVPGHLVDRFVRDMAASVERAYSVVQALHRDVRRCVVPGNRRPTWMADETAEPAMLMIAARADLVGKRAAAVARLIDTACGLWSRRDSLS